jgi:hypothetical protein
LRADRSDERGVIVRGGRVVGAVGACTIGAVGGRVVGAVDRRAVSAIVSACLVAAGMIFVVAPGCGGSPSSSSREPSAPTTAAPPAYMGTPIEQRRDAACDQLGPRLTACAVEDARADLAAGKITRTQLDQDTAPAIQHQNTENFLKACKGSSYSSRQVRVLEVCSRDAPDCGQLVDCLGHLNDKPTDAKP